jgi:hypothetical protein
MSCLVLGYGGLALAQGNPTEGCANAIDAYKDGDVELALEEVRWCLEGLEQIKQSSIATSFKDSFLGYTGGKMENNRNMGMVIINRSYSKDETSIKVTLTQSSGVGATNPLSALGAITKIGMFGSGPTVRLHGHTGVQVSTGRSASLMVTPRGGEGMVNFESRDVDMDEVTAFAKAFMKDFGR